MEKVGISSPWVSYYHKLQALFGEDPDIQLAFDNDGPEAELFVSNTDKAEALGRLLPGEVQFGNVTLKIAVVPANIEWDEKALMEKAFTGNPMFSKVLKLDVGSTNPFTYVVFARKVVQFYDDNLGDPHGNVTTLAQDLAKELLTESGGVYYCTENYMF